GGGVRGADPRVQPAGGSRLRRARPADPGRPRMSGGLHPWRAALWGTFLARLCTLLLAARVLLAPLVSPWQAGQLDWEALAAPPTTPHWFGTDLIGRDLLVRSAEGARVSLALALIATAVSTLIGIPWGALAGYLGGRVDAL